MHERQVKNLKKPEKGTILDPKPLYRLARNNETKLYLVSIFDISPL